MLNISEFPGMIPTIPGMIPEFSKMTKRQVSRSKRSAACLNSDYGLN